MFDAGIVINSLFSNITSVVQWLELSSPVRSRLVLFKQETKHVAPSSKSKDWNQDNVFKWSDMSNRGLLFQWASTIANKLSVLVLYKANIIVISLNYNLCLRWFSRKLLILAMKNNHPLPLFVDATF
jgi:hypothetical protein